MTKNFKIFSRREKSQSAKMANKSFNHSWFIEAQDYEEIYKHY